ncbi:MAG: hypothetical protein JO250_00390 [Armatimonadetes bacterium]|nr:hypothetical protein [Armatimonadota bacterium]
MTTPDNASWPPAPDRPPAPDPGGVGEESPPPAAPEAGTKRAIFAYLAFNLLLPLIPVHPHRLSVGAALGLVVVPTVLFMLLQLWLARALVSLRPGVRASLLAAALAAAVWLVVLQVIHPHRGWALSLNFPLALLRPLLLGLSITLSCTFFGIALSRIVREANVLLPIALVAMPIDYIGAMTPIGFTQNAVQQHPGIVRAVSIPVPAVGGLHPLGFIGPGDALFLAFFLAIVQRLNLNLRGTFWGMYGLLTATMLLVLVTGVNVAALVPMGLALLIANWPAFRLQRSEVFATLYAVLLVLALAVAFYAYSHAHFFHH